MDIKLPVEARQKFQIGDICKIVEEGEFRSEFQFPKCPLESYKQDRECIILHTYAQAFWGTNFSDYSVYLLPRNEEEYTGSLAWIEENQLRYIRKPTNKEIEIVVKNDDRSLEDGSPYTSIFNTETRKFKEENGLALFVSNLMKDGCFNR